MIELKSVHKVYKVSKDIHVNAARGIDLFLAKGEFTAIMGPSGSGKTTVLNMIGCVDRPTDGDIFINGLRVSNLSDSSLVRLRRTEIGYLFQFFNLIANLTAFENAEMSLWMLDTAMKKKGKEKIKYLFNVLGIDQLKNRFPKQMSGGQQQRVALARALAHSPKILIADEPTGNLDSETTGLMMDIMKNENREFGITFIISTHNAALLPFFDRVIYLKDGMIDIKQESIKKKSGKTTDDNI
jgi:putative ABC transport system ATP-binding protein